MFDARCSPRWWRPIAVCAVLLAGACSGDDDSSADDAPAPTDGAVDSDITAAPVGAASSEVCVYAFELSEAISTEAFESDALQEAYETMVDVTTRGATLTQGSVSTDLAALAEGLAQVNAILADAEYDFDAVDPAVFDEFGALAVPSSRIEEFFAAECDIDIVPDDYNGAELDEGGFVTFPAGRVSELPAGSAAPGPDEALDALWTACAEPDLPSCDQLYSAAPRDTMYSTFGATCGAVESISRLGQCSVDPAGAGAAAGDGEPGEGGLAVFDPGSPLSADDPAPGPDAELDGLWTACGGGDPEACNNLYLAAPIGSVYEAFGATCAGANPDVVGGGACA